MTLQLNDRLRDWMEAAAGCPVSFGLPQLHVAGRGIGLYLISMQRTSEASRPHSLSLVLRYLVTAWADDVAAAQATLIDAAFAAMESNDFEVEAEAPPLELWRGFGMAPQPAFLLRTVVHRERTRPTAKPVMHPVRVELVTRAAFFGKVVGPGDLPLSNCSVAVPALGLSTLSDREGRFSFAGLPASGGVQFLLRARNHEALVRSDKTFSTSTAPVLIRFNVLEE